MPSPYPEDLLDGIAIEPMVSTPLLPSLPAPIGAGLRRITFEPGTTLDLRYAGPVVYYVERGVLGFRFDGRRLAILGTEAAACGSRTTTAGSAEHTLTAGCALYAADGNLGAIRNAGGELLVVLALLIVPEPAGASASDEATAMPAGPASTPGA